MNMFPDSNRAEESKQRLPLQARRVLGYSVVGLILATFPAHARGQETVLARWNFGTAPQGYVVEEIGQHRDPIEGTFSSLPAASGATLQFDGYTTAIHHPAIRRIAEGPDISIAC